MTDVKHILSFDCADKTLGICIIGWIPKNYIAERVECIISEDRPEYTLYYIQKLNAEILTAKKMWLFNLLPTENVRETTDSVRLGRLKFALLTVRRYMTDNKIKPDNILVEYQMGQNDLSRLISAAIIYEFCTEDPNIIINIGNTDKCNTDKCKDIEKKDINSHINIIMPAGKNSFYFHTSLSYGTFAAKYKTNKTANKHHTSENFKYFLQNQNASISPYKFDIKINHGEINHIADAFMQAVYWILEQWNH